MCLILGAFEDDDVTHVEGDVNPVRDLDIISEELRLKDMEFLNVHLEKLEKLVIRGNDKKLKPEYVSTRLLYFSKIGNSSMENLNFFRNRKNGREFSVKILHQS